MASSLKKRFWKFVNKTDKCWLWTGKIIDSGGYGRIKLKGKGLKAHRVSWEIHNGPIPAGINVLHNCPTGDNPLCVNPSHLWLGTQADNVKDMWEKGRGNNTGQKLTEEQVKIIKDSSGPRDQLSKIFNISVAQIRNIQNGKQWKKVE